MWDTFGMDMCGICAMCWICVGYVWWIRLKWICVGYVKCAGYVWDMCGVRYANNLLKNPATKRLSGKNRTLWLLHEPCLSDASLRDYFSDSVLYVVPRRAGPKFERKKNKFPIGCVQYQPVRGPNRGFFWRAHDTGLVRGTPFDPRRALQ